MLYILLNVSLFKSLKFFLFNKYFKSFSPSNFSIFISDSSLNVNSFLAFSTKISNNNSFSGSLICPPPSYLYEFLISLIKSLLNISPPRQLSPPDVFTFIEFFGFIVSRVTSNLLDPKSIIKIFSFF